MSFDDAITMHELCKAIKECCKGVSWKGTPQDYANHRLLKAKSLQMQILKGRYKPMKCRPVQICRPKRREASAPAFRDRVWQRAMCNNGVYDGLTHNLIYDNMACQKGKGMDLAIKRIYFFLRDYFRKNKSNIGWIRHLDIKKYFPSTPNKILKEHDRDLISDKRFIPYLDQIIDSGTDKRGQSCILSDPFGKRGTDLGSQINQLNQVSLLHELDLEIKAMTPYYIRYNDDFLYITETKDESNRIKQIIVDYLKDIGLELTDKSGVQPLKNGAYFMQHRFVLTRTGKIVIKLNHKKFTDERKTLRNLKRLVLQGKRTMEDVRTHYQSFIAYANTADSDSQIKNMDRFYSNLFREEPKYKRKGGRIMRIIPKDQQIRELEMENKSLKYRLQKQGDMTDLALMLQGVDLDEEDGTDEK